MGLFVSTQTPKCPLKSIQPKHFSVITVAHPKQIVWQSQALCMLHLYKQARSQSEHNTNNEKPDSLSAGLIKVENVSPLFLLSKQIASVEHTQTSLTSPGCKQHSSFQLSDVALSEQLPVKTHFYILWGSAQGAPYWLLPAWSLCSPLSEDVVRIPHQWKLDFIMP